MKRRTFILGTAAALTPTSPPRALAARSEARIGVFFSGSPQTAFERTWGRSFVSALRGIGWIEGQNLAIEWRYSEDRDDRRRAIVDEFLRLKIDVIVVQSTPETAVAKRLTRTVPIVMVLVGDPVGSALVDSLARPGGNITGTSLMATDTAGKRLEVLRELVPTARHVAILGNRGNAAVARSWLETLEAGNRNGMRMVSVEVQTHDDVIRAFAAMTRDRPDAMVVILDSLMVDHRHDIVDFVAKNRIPTVYGGPMFADAGGLLVYTVDFHELWRRAAVYVDRILRGVKPADLPIDQPTKFQLTINVKAAKALGITVPPSLLLRADQVIE